MAGEYHSGSDSGREALRNGGSRSPLKTILKLLFWFGVLCIGLVSMISFFAYKRYQDYRRDQLQYDQSQSPIPAAPIEITFDSPPQDEASPFSSTERTADAEKRTSEESTMPANNVAAPADAPLEGAHASARVASGIVINEIFFHPRSSDEEPEDTRAEFIELHNAGTSDVSLEGYELKKGVKFTFPALTLPAGGYVVIAADPEVFRQQHPDAGPVLGGWRGKLSNTGEDIELEDADGEKVDSVNYSDGGDWAARSADDSRRSVTRNRGFIFGSNSSRRNSRVAGWEWSNPADGDGFSLELRSAAVTNQNGQNWQPSAERGGSPGRRNSAYSPDIAPVITNVKHRPVIPSPSDAVTVSATIKDELKSGITAEVFWRVSSDRADASFKTVAMVVDSSKFSATIPAQENGDIVEFFVRATDGTYSRTWPASTNRGQAANALFQVEADAEEPAPGFALYRLVMTQQDNQSFQRMNRHTDAQVNATLIADDGAGPIVRYNCGVRYRGAGSRDHFPTPMRVNLPSDDPWHGFTKMNLNSKYSWLQFIGMKIFTDAGERAPDMKPATVRSNGVDLMAPRGGRHGGSLKGDQKTDYGFYVHAEPLGTEWVERHFPEDPDGNSYKKVRPDTSWAYRNGRLRYYLRDGWSKNSNIAAADWTDLDEFLRVMNQAPNEGDYLDQVKRVANLDQWYRWLGINAIVANGEGGLAKGIDDDYGLYRGVIDRRFVILPHDLDTILAGGDRSRESDAYHTLFDFAEKGDRIGPLDDLFELEEVRARYLEQIRDLVETTFAPRHFNALLQNQLGTWVPENELRKIISWMNTRRVYAASEADILLGENRSPRPRPETLGSLQQLPPANDLRINEIMATGVGQTPDFIEILNATNAPIDASGYRLTDNEKKPDKYSLPEGTILQPGEYLVVTENECGFRLEASGESVSLFPVDSEVPVDAVVFGLQVPGYSIGRVNADGSRWTLNQPTPADTNIEQSIGDPDQICINEWMVHPHTKFDLDFVEFFNKGQLPVAFGGMHVTDDPINYPERFTIQQLSYAGANSFVLFKAAGKDASKGNARHLPMKFAYEYGAIAAIGSNGVQIDKIGYQCHRRDISQGRSEDGGEFFTYYPEPTPGTSNTAPPQMDGDVNHALANGLRITEIMFHPVGHSGLEFIELANAGSTELNLKGVRFTQGIDFEFEDDFMLAPGACAVLAANAVDFAAEYGADIPVAGEFKGKLSNSGETIQLKLPKPSERLILSIDFDDKWHIDADGLGKSLVLRDLKLSREECGDYEAWNASAEDKGSPGRLE